MFLFSFIVILAASIFIGFGSLLYWDVIWPLWTFGVVLALGGIDAMKDNRKVDMRFKTGYKWNAEDPTDVSLGKSCTSLAS